MEQTSCSDGSLNIEDEMHTLHAHGGTVDNGGVSRASASSSIEYHGATVGADSTVKQCTVMATECMPTVNTSPIPTSVAVVLLCVHWFVADEACFTFCWSKTEQPL